MAIKSKVVSKEELKVNFPKLMYFRSYMDGKICMGEGIDGAIALITGTVGSGGGGYSCQETYAGTIIGKLPGGMMDDSKIGHRDVNWVMTNWFDFNGEVTLSNGN